MQARPWVACYGRTPPDIDPDIHPSVVHLLEEAMRQFADLPAFRCLGQTLTFADVDRLSLNFAAYLQRVAGVRKGDRVALMMPNLLAFPIAFLGIARAGAVHVGINPSHPAREVARKLGDAQVACVVVYDGASATLAQALSYTPIQHVLHTGLGDGSGRILAGGPDVDPRLAGAFSFAMALEQGRSAAFTRVPLAADDVLLLQYTDGATGTPKAVALRHRNVLASVEQFKASNAHALRPGKEVVVTAQPLHHLFALSATLITYFSLGADSWLLPQPHELSQLMSVLHVARPSVFLGDAPTYRCLTTYRDSHRVDWSRLRLAVATAASLPDEVRERWMQLTGNFIQTGYGLAESSGLAAFEPIHGRGSSPGGGVPLPSTDVKLLTPEGRVVPSGQVGEICIRGPQVMTEYWRQPDATLAAFTPDGYLRSGDAGILDQDGLLDVLGRVEDGFRVSGALVFPDEVEAAAIRCQGIAECACVGVPDELTGRTAALLVVPAPGVRLTEAKVLAHCGRLLCGPKLPRHVRFVTALPRTPSGKLLRRDLRVPDLSAARTRLPKARRTTSNSSPTASMEHYFWTTSSSIT